MDAQLPKMSRADIIALLNSTLYCMDGAENCNDIKAACHNLYSLLTRESISMNDGDESSVHEHPIEEAIYKLHKLVC